MSTIQNPGILEFRPASMKKWKESIKYALIPFFDPGYLKCLLPLDEESKSFSRKDIFALFVHTDRVFNKLALEAYHRAKDVDQQNYNSSVATLMSINDRSKVVIPSIRSLLDNQMLALQFKSLTASPNRTFHQGLTQKHELDELLTFER